MNTRPVILRPLLGIDQRYIPEANTMRRLQDVRWDPGGAWAEGPGYRRLLLQTAQGANPYASSGTVTSLHWFAQKNGARQFLIYESDTGELRVFNPSAIRTGNPWDVAIDNTAAQITNRAVVNAPWQRSQSATWGDLFYLINGINEPLVFNGTYWDRAGFDVAPPAPTVALVRGSSADPNPIWRFVSGGTRQRMDGVGLGFGVELKSAYRWRVSFINERGQESPPSEPSNILIVPRSTSAFDGNLCARLTLPIGGNNIVARRLYRTANLMDSSEDFTSPAASALFYYLGDVHDNQTTLWEDFAPDTALGSVLDDLDFGTWPTGAKYLAPWDGRMWLVTDDGAWFSASGRPEVYPPDNFVPIKDVSGGPSSGVWATRSSLLVFKARSIWRIFREGGGYRGVLLVSGIGCAAPNTIKEVPGLGLAFLSESGVHLLSGAVENDATPTQPVLLSTPIPDEIQRLNRSALLNAVAVVSRRLRELQLYVPTLSSADPNRCLVFHLDNGQWSVRDGFPVACALETADHRQYVIFGSHDSTTNPGLHVLSLGWQYKGESTAVSPLLETHDLALGGQYRSFQPRHVHAQVLGVGNNDLNFNLRVNRGLSDVRTTADGGSLAKDQQPADARYQLAVYDTALWGTATWGEHHPVVVRYDVAVGSVGPCYDMRARFTPSGRRVGWVSLDVEVTEGEAGKIQPQTTSTAPSRRV